MNEEVFSDLAIEKSCKEYFGVPLDIGNVLVRAVPVGVATKATLFTAANGQVYLHIMSQSALVLDDVQKIVHRMQCVADTFLPPHAEKDYFDRIGRAKFKVMFPGKHISSDEDLRYYKNLAPYSPALVRISKVKGEVRGFDREAKMWRKVKDYSYSTIQPK